VHCEKLAETLPAYGGERDIYITPNTFRGPRRVSRILQLRALYSDLDYYNIPDLADMQPQGILDMAFEALEQAHIPPPSLAIDTGRGLALVWRHEPAPRGALSRWKRCQRDILEALGHLGADPSAIDAARVLRLAGTYNSKSETLVHSIWEDLEEIWDFESLADEVLPYTRRQIAECRAQHAEERALRDARMPPKPKREARQGFIRALNQKRMSDLNRLMEIRGQEKLPPGKRDEWMFVAGVVSSYLIRAEFLERELVRLGCEKADWSEAETKRNMQTVVRKAHDAASGGTKVEWAGHQRDPRYWLTNEEIIRRLAITPKEEEAMQTILSAKTRQRREKERKEQQRRSKGIKPRSEYVNEAKERNEYHRLIAAKLSNEGMSLRQVSRELGISHTQVGRLLKSTPPHNASTVTSPSVI